MKLKMTFLPFMLLGSSMVGAKTPTATSTMTIVPTAPLSVEETQTIADAANNVIMHALRA